MRLWDAKKAADAARRNLESARPDWIVNTLAEAITQVCPVAHCQSCAALESTADGPGEERIETEAGPVSPEDAGEPKKTQDLVDANG